ncbi:MAG TPA: ATP-binding protein [Pilimelia sp.]|nr:ATP-binding protein [Pilimelia sp.]
MVIGTAGLAVGFALAGLVLVAALGAAVQRTVDDQALGTAREVASLVTAGAAADPLPVAGRQYVQVVDQADRVHAASLGADRLTPFVTPAELPRVRAGARLDVDGSRLALVGPVRLVGVPAGSDATVVVATPVADIRQSVTTLSRALWLAYPVILLVLVALAWRVTGAALRPVEVLRRGAARITGAASEERLPAPPTDDEIGRLAHTLNDMLDRLAAARARQRAFVADAAHELRSPLASLRTQIEVAGRLGEQVPAVAEDLLSEVDRLSRIVEDLLLLARAEDAPRHAGPLPPVPLPDLLAAAAGRLVAPRVPVSVAAGPGPTPPGPTPPGRAAPGRTAPDPAAPGPTAPGTAAPDTAAPRTAAPDTAASGTAAPDTAAGGTTAPGPATDLTVPGDADGLARALDNLLHNAVRHAATKVELSLHGQPDAVEVWVTDDGPGIPAADRERVFDRFTRLDEARDRDGGGSGLGLAIVREIARRHGGTVGLHDAAPGIRAVLRLPRAPAGPGHP